MKGVCEMLKRLSILLILIMVLNLFTSAVSAGNTAITSGVKQQVSEVSKQSNKHAMPDRKADIEILDKKSGQIFRQTIYLTPSTSISKDSFKKLNNQYELKSIKVSELTDVEKEEIGILWVDTILFYTFISTT